MFLVRANTTIQVPVPQDSRSWNRWLPYTTKEDRLYDKHEVFDRTSLLNGREMPEWIRQNIQLGYVIIERNGRYAQLKPADIEFLD